MPVKVIGVPESIVTVQLLRLIVEPVVLSSSIHSSLALAVVPIQATSFITTERTAKEVVLVGVLVRVWVEVEVEVLVDVDVEVEVLVEVEVEVLVEVLVVAAL